MTDGDKLAKVKAEIERRKKMNILNENKYEEDIDLLSFYNSMQEEPEYLEEETTYCAFSTSRYTDKDRKALCKGCDEECKFKPIASVWHDAKAEEPKFERWILMADDHGHYMAGLWQNDGKGFEGIGEIHIGPLKFNLPLGLEGDIVRWCYISDIDKNEKGGYCD